MARTQNISAGGFGGSRLSLGGSSGISSAGSVPYGDLATQINSLMTREASKPYAANLPDYANMVGKRSQNISSQLAGQVPDDVVNQIIQTGAERGILTGSAMSPNANAAMLRALGLTSLGLQQQGSQNLTAAINDTPVPQLFNPASLIVPTELARQSQRAASAGLGSGVGPGGWSGGGVSINPNNPITDFGFKDSPAPNYMNPPAVYGSGDPSADLWNSKLNSGQAYSDWLNTYGTPFENPQSDNQYIDSVYNSIYGNDVNDPAYWQTEQGFQDPNRPADPVDPWAGFDYSVYE